MNILTTAFLLFLFITTLHSASLDYYWRDYAGEIPDDALPGGNDQNQKATYVGQVYIPNHGILPTRIYEGQKSVTVSKNGIHTSEFFVKILCTNLPEKLSWMPTTSASVYNDTVGKSLVIGGTEDGKILSIGRISYQGEVIVGKVCSYNPGKAFMYFPYGGEEVGAASYEVLTYTNAY